MQLRVALTTFALTIGLAQAQSIDPLPRGFGTPPPAAPPPSPGPATPAPDPTIPAAEPPPGAIAPPSDPDNLPPNALPLAIAPAEPALVAPRPYPRALVERPLVIPDGTIEAALSFVVARSEVVTDKAFTSMGVSPNVSYAVGRFGLSAGADVILDVTPDEVMLVNGLTWQFQDEQRLAAAYASARFAPTPDLSLRIQFVGQGLTTDVPRTTTRLAASYKARLSSKLAVIPAVSIGFSRTTYDDVRMNIAEARTAFVAGGRLGAEVQVSPLVALVVRSEVGLRYEGAADPDAFVLVGEPGASTFYDHGVHLVGSLTSHVDLIASGLAFFSDRPSVLQLALGFSVRTP